MMTKSEQGRARGNGQSPAREQFCSPARGDCSHVTRFSSRSFHRTGLTSDSNARSSICLWVYNTFVPPSPQPFVTLTRELVNDEGPKGDESPFGPQR